MRATPTKPLPAILTAVFAGFCLYCLPPLTQYGAVRCWYSLQYSISPNTVTIAPKPHDCDYDWSPLGNKGCHYSKHITTVRTAKTTYGAAVISYDEGQTWRFADGQGSTTQLDGQTIAITSVDLFWLYEKDE